jgi:hypothetical protein
MRFKFAALLVGAFFLVTVPAFAGTVDFCAGQTPNSDIGSSVTVGGITATGWLSNNKTVDLYCKSQGSSENGLGLAGTLNDEIGVGNFIQLDMSAVSFMTSILTIESVQSTEGFSIIGNKNCCTLAGGTTIGGATGGGTDTATVNFTGFRYVDITATAGNVLLGDVVTPTPEPSTYLLMGTGLLMLGFVVRRKFASASV